MNTTLDRTFAAAVERELAAIGTRRSRLQRHQRHVRALAIGGGSVALAGALAGAAVVAGGLPGQTTVTPIGEAVSGSFTGTATIDLGPAPEWADRIILDVTCSEGGKIEVPTNPGQGARSGSVFWTCSDPVRATDTVHIDDGLLPAKGATTITVTADAGTPWSVVARYGSSTTKPWGVNARGETYGVPNDDGIPDLVAAQASNGEIGYTRNSEQSAFEGEGYIKVYESDGETVIGWFPIGDPAELGDPPPVPVK
ncbi:MULTISPECIES: hypothetical protein [unclassified Microbacterium]|uniref:hypothetical protein n=1 Tax=unclassified Microbacterium TaxID=2609290 RepID=UPI0018DF1526|nr:hypothetical protein [Microbacterium sp. MAH-37]